MEPNIFHTGVGYLHYAIPNGLCLYRLTKHSGTDP